MTRQNHSHTDTGIPGLSFSWKRAIGLTRLENKISRTTGIPLSRAGRERKIGHFAIHLMGYAIVAGLGYLGWQIAMHPAWQQTIVHVAQAGYAMVHHTA